MTVAGLGRAGLRGPGSGPVSAGAVAALIFAVAAAAALARLAATLPPDLWASAVLAPDPDDIRHVLVRHVWATRVAVALVGGAALGLSGALLQLVLRNPLVAPSTLGITAGAKLGLIAATLWLPDAAGLGREAAAFAGGAAAAALAVGLALHKDLSPVPLILAGLVVSLYLGAAGAVLLLFHEVELGSVFLWGAGALGQQSWGPTGGLALRLALAGLAVAALIRPLLLLEMPEIARGLGVPVTAVRLAAAGVAVALGAAAVASLGVIAFIGLGAPAIARLAGIDRPAARLVWAPVFGAVLLFAADQAVQLAFAVGARTVPTGAATAVIGAPLLIVLLMRLKPTDGVWAPLPGTDPRPTGRVLAALVGLLAAVCALALLVGVTPRGLELAGPRVFADVAPWRWPGVAGALGAGALFAVAGVLIQRLTRNPVASPEVTGISAGAALALVLLLHADPAAGLGARLSAGSAGALVALAAIMVLGGRAGFRPERVLLAGIAVAALFEATVAALLASGNPRAALILEWLSGSTYGLGPREAAAALVAAAAVLLGAVACRHWLDLLVLGDAVGTAVGMPVRAARTAVLVLAAVATAAGTLMVGPLSFVGLLAPHLARYLGLTRALPQVLGAALLGAAVMVAADWLGRTVAFPRQIPAGLMAATIGGPYLLWLLRRT